MKLLFFDVETNGLDSYHHSVLSICMIKVKVHFNSKKKLSFTEEEIFQRYYLPKEPFNEEAIKINGLTADVINKKRQKKNWPRLFIQDCKDVFGFIRDVDRFVAHNLSFDKKFVPFEILRANGFCTMTDLIFKKKKWLKLKELVKLFDVELSKLPSNKNFHEAEYDTRCVMEIFKKAYEDELQKNRIDKFFEGVPSDRNFESIGRSYSRALDLLNDNLNEVKKYRVYLVRDLTNGCLYVGMTGRPIEARKEEHIKQAKTSPDSSLQEAIAKKGPDKFEWIELCNELSHIQACEIEGVLVLELKTQRPGWGYNKLRGGDDIVRLINSLDSKNVKIWREIVVKSARDKDLWRYKDEIVQKTVSLVGGKHERAYYQRKKSWKNRGKNPGSVSPRGDDFYIKYTKKLWNMYHKENDPVEKEKIMEKIKSRGNC